MVYPVYVSNATSPQIKNFTQKTVYNNKNIDEIKNKTIKENDTKQTTNIGLEFSSENISKTTRRPHINHVQSVESFFRNQTSMHIKTNQMVRLLVNNVVDPPKRNTPKKTHKNHAIKPIDGPINESKTVYTNEWDFLYGTH